MRATTPDELKAQHAAFKDLVESPGWTLLREYVTTTWGGTWFVGQLEKELDNPADEAAVSRLRQVVAAKRAVLQVMSWPEEQLAKAKRALPEAVETPAVEKPARRRGRL